MKRAYVTLLTASSLCFGIGAFAKDTILLPVNQNNCTAANRVAAQKQKQEAANKIGAQTQKQETTREAQKTNSNRSRKPHNEHPIDLVICLDTSSSMNGLIDSAKQKIWDIVNELATAKPKPHLRVGLYAYGTPGFGRENGFVQKKVELTDDLDKVFTELTALRTNGGDEYCARVISASTKQQTWDTDKKALKIIVLAGNESATQDPKIDVFAAAKDAISNGIIINTIYCGSPANPEASDWRKVATATDGQFASIDQNNGTVVISTPFDQQLSELGGKINRTYVGYGSRASYGRQKQMEADSMSNQLGASNAASRAVAKASDQYRNSSWDLLDARSEKGFSLSKMKKEDLPPEMQKMSQGEQQEYLDKKTAERTEIQKQIADLNVQRAKYIQEEIKKSGKATDKGFDAAMLKALREQAQKNGFTFETKK